MKELSQIPDPIYLSMLEGRCDIYHLIEEVEKPHPALNGSPVFTYPQRADISGVACHFCVRDKRAAILETGPRVEYDADIELELPPDTDIRINDKVVDLRSGIEYTAGMPRDHFGHHVSVRLRRRKNRRAL